MPLRSRRPRRDGDADAVLEALRGRGATLATAESLTGGAVGAALTAVPGASEVYVGGVVAYATSLKVALLGVSEAVVESDGVVSAACATAMAHGVRDLTGATYGLATTGVAGPEAQEGKPPGTVFVGLAGPAGPVGEQVLSLELTPSSPSRRSLRDASSLGSSGQALRDLLRYQRPLVLPFETPARPSLRHARSLLPGSSGQARAPQDKRGLLRTGGGRHEVVARTVEEALAALVAALDGSEPG